MLDIRTMPKEKFENWGPHVARDRSFFRDVNETIPMFMGFPHDSVFVCREGYNWRASFLDREDGELCKLGFPVCGGGDRWSAVYVLIVSVWNHFHPSEAINDAWYVRALRDLSSSVETSHD